MTKILYVLLSFGFKFFNLNNVLEAHFQSKVLHKVD
jgi:hypothetical protein